MRIHEYVCSILRQPQQPSEHRSRSTIVAAVLTQARESVDVFSIEYRVQVMKRAAIVHMTLQDRTETICEAWAIRSAVKNRKGERPMSSCVNLGRPEFATWSQYARSRLKSESSGLRRSRVNGLVSHQSLTD